MSDLARLVLSELRSDPTALAELRALVGAGDPAESPSPTAVYTVGTLAVQLGRSERSIRAAIGRGELAAVKRGRGYVIGADAVAAWTRAVRGPERSASSRPRRRPGSPSRPGPGPMARALRREPG